METVDQRNGGKKPSRADVATAVRRFKNFKGVTGSIEFDSKAIQVKANTSSCSSKNKPIPASRESHRTASAGGSRQEIVSLRRHRESKMENRRWRIEDGESKIDSPSAISTRDLPSCILHPVSKNAQ